MRSSWTTETSLVQTESEAQGPRIFIGLVDQVIISDNRKTANMPCKNLRNEKKVYSMLSKMSMSVCGGLNARLRKIKQSTDSIKDRWISCVKRIIKKRNESNRRHIFPMNVVDNAIKPRKNNSTGRNKLSVERTAVL